MPYIGTSPSNGVRQTYDYTATAGQTSFSGSDNNSQTLTYTDSAYIDVYQNGILLVPSDYTATTGTTVVLDTGATVSDTLQIVVYDVFSVADTVSASDGGTFGGNVGVGGTLSVSGDLTIPDKIIHDGDTNTAIRFPSADTVTIETSGSERARVDSNGNLLVGKTAHNFQTAGFQVEQSSGETVATRDGGTPLIANRLTNDGELIGFYKAATNIGSIKSSGGVTIDIDGGGDRVGLAFTGDSYLPRKNGSLSDDTNSIGDGSRRLDNIFATNSSINTSDKNEKQDIEELTDAEKRVAVVAKGLMRKYRWKSRVAQKGDNARTHFGIIAQDLQDAFTAESLDASDYAMFCSDTWTNDDGSEQTRLGVRYSELLAFIISAI